MYKRILLAYDGTDAGQKALLDCIDLAQWSQSELSLIAVMPSAMSFVGLEGGVYDIELEEREKKKHQAILDDGLRRLAEAGSEPRLDVRELGRPVWVVAGLAERHVDARDRR